MMLYLRHCPQKLYQIKSEQRAGPDEIFSVKRAVEEYFFALGMRRNSTKIIILDV